MNGKLFLKHGDGSKVPGMLLTMLSMLRPDQAIEITVVPARCADDTALLDLAEFGRARLWDQLDQNVDGLELSIRVQNILANANIRLVGELVRMSETQYLRRPSTGRRTLREIKELLAPMGLSLGMNVHGWTPRRGK